MSNNTIIIVDREEIEYLVYEAYEEGWFNSNPEYPELDVDWKESVTRMKLNALLDNWSK